LIVTPPQLLLQWIDELAHHAPTLRVHHYQGWKYQGQLIHPEEGNGASTTGQKRKRSAEIDNQPAASNVQAEEEAWTHLVRSHDVVVTTYMVLQNDLHFARPPVQRPRRGGRPEPVRKRSSLITIEYVYIVDDFETWLIFEQMGAGDYG
jgi:E3 ubiquitin-protein ligase SHPRH